MSPDACPRCGAAPGEPCRGPLSGMMLSWVHLERGRDTEPCPAPASEQTTTAPERLCAYCSQPLSYGVRVLRCCEKEYCGDCWNSVDIGWGGPDQIKALDQRIREAQPDDAHHCAWSTPTGDGEGWR